MAVLQKNNQTSGACSPHILPLGLLRSQLNGPFIQQDTCWHWEESWPLPFYKHLALLPQTLKHLTSPLDPGPAFLR